MIGESRELQIFHLNLVVFLCFTSIITRNNMEIVYFSNGAVLSRRVMLYFNYYYIRKRNYKEEFKCHVIYFIILLYFCNFSLRNVIFINAPWVIPMRIREIIWHNMLALCSGEISGAIESSNSSSISSNFYYVRLQINHTTVVIFVIILL